MFVANSVHGDYSSSSQSFADIELGVVLRDFAAAARAVVVGAQIELREPRLALDVSARAKAERVARAGRAIEAQLDARVPRRGHEQERPLVPRRRLLFDDTTPLGLRFAHDFAWHPRSPAVPATTLRVGSGRR